MDTNAFSIDEFCEAHRISRAMYYSLEKDGNGPRLMQVGRRVLISAEAAAEWRQRMEKATAQREGCRVPAQMAA